MQVKLRKLGEKGMAPEELKRFTEAHETGKLLKPEEWVPPECVQLFHCSCANKGYFLLDNSPGYVMAALAVEGHKVHSSSGQFLSWNDQDILKEFQRPQ